MQTYQNKGLKDYYEIFIDNPLCSSDSYLYDCYKALLKQRRKTDSHTPDTILKLAFLCLQMKHQYGFDFIVSLGLAKQEHKFISYLGLMLCETDLYPLMINTLHKDLESEVSEDYALKYLCNFANRSSVFNEVCIKKYKKQQSKHFEKYILIKYGNGLKKCSFNDFLVDKRIFFIKLQIILDTWSDNQNKNYAFLAKNDTVKQFQDLFFGSKERYMKIKLLQLLRKIGEEHKIVYDENFVLEINKTLSASIFSAKHDFELCFYYEICDFLLQCNNRTESAKRFVYHLLNSKKTYQVMTAVDLVIKYDIHKTLAAIKLLMISDKSKRLKKLILKILSAKNYQEIYAEIFIDKKSISLKAQKNMLKKFLVAYKCFDECFLVDILIEYPYVIKKLQKSLHLTQKSYEKLVIAISQSNDIQNHQLVTFLLSETQIPNDILQKTFDYYVQNLLKFWNTHNSKQKIEYLTCITALSVKIGYKIENHFTYIKSFASMLQKTRNKQQKHYLNDLINYYNVFANMQAFFDKENELFLYRIESGENEVKKKIMITTQSKSVKPLENTEEYTIDKSEVCHNRFSISLELIDFEKTTIAFKYLRNGSPCKQEIIIND